MSRINLNPRLYLVFLFFIILFPLLIARLVYVQIFQSAQLKAIANEQHNIFVEVEPQRGIIFDRNFRELAINTVSYSIYATEKFKPGQDQKDKLCWLLGIDNDYLVRKINEHKKFVWLKRKVTPEILQAIRDLDIAGIGQVKEYKRFYPNTSLASHIIGFTNVDNKGLEGIELYCDYYLVGIKGWRLAQKDAKRREVICWKQKSILPTDGYNLVLTLDSVIQSIAERNLRKAARKYRAISATAIVMNPKNGEILALYNYPDYDLNNIQDYGPELRRNLAVTDLFEPGSSFKFVTAAAALEENLFSPEDKFFCERGKYRIGGRILHDYRPYGELTFKEVLEHSSNIGVVKVAQSLGSELLYKYIRSFGFGGLTEVDLPGEVKGIVREPKGWSKVSISAVPIGQEIAVTPLQLICAISCIANDGVLLKPKIIKYIQHQDGHVIKSFPVKEVRSVVSVETAQVLKTILIGCVEKGTGKRAKVKGYKTAGKTGTAQKAQPAGGYYRNKYFATFIGFLPADKPIISILVVLNEPQPVYFGGRVAAPVFRKIATETLSYLKMSEESR